MGRVFAIGPEDWDSIPRQVIPRTHKMVLNAALLSTQFYKVRIKGKVEQSGNSVVPSLTPQCCNYTNFTLYAIHIYQQLRLGRIWHKVNFLSGV